MAYRDHSFPQKNSVNSLAISFHVPWQITPNYVVDSQLTKINFFVQNIQYFVIVSVNVTQSAFAHSADKTLENS